MFVPLLLLQLLLSISLCDGQGGAGRVNQCGSGKRCFPTYGWIVLGVAAAILFLFILVPVYIYNSAYRCYICEARLWFSQKKRMEHREMCGAKYQHLLDSLNTPYRIHCPHCSSVLKEWPGYRMLHPDEPVPPNFQPFKFKCDGAYCSSKEKGGNKKRPMMLEEGNRFCCYLCDYDICNECAVKEVEAMGGGRK